MSPAKAPDLLALEVCRERGRCRDRRFLIGVIGERYG